MSDPKAQKFYPTGGAPVTLDFASTDGMTETVDVPATGVAISNPMHVRVAELFVANGVLTTKPPKKKDDA